MKNKILAGIAALILALVGAGSAQAQAQAEVSPGVARISFIHGDVSTQRGDSGEWSAAALNAPLVNGDKVSTGNRSRAEVQLDYADIMRLADDTQINLATLTRTQIQIQVAQGLVNYSVFKGSEADTEIDTPNVAIRPSRGDGSYRILVNPGGETQVIVRKGEADISTPQGSTRVTQGQLITVQGTGDSVQYKVSEAPSKDDFDSWNKDRDNLIRNAQSWHNTNKYYTGSEDLDAYGHWTNVPDYGQVWVPAAAPGWAPYRDGQWVWEPYYGWTWVSYEPWGWAPYHYGRWFPYGGGWAWWPGPVYAYPAYYPVWSPAYVSFFGFGYGGGGWHFGFGVGFGSIGWFPIGPCDRFYPWWGGYRNHFNVVNITNITNIKNVTNINNGVAPLHAGNRFSNLQQLQTNQRLRQAVSTVPSEKFGAGHVQPVAATSSMLHDGHLMTGNLPVVPTHASLSASGRPASSTTLQARQPQNFFSKSQPAAAPRPFNEQAGQIQQAIQRDGHFAPVNGDARSNAANSAKASAPLSQNAGAVGAGKNTTKFTPPSFSKNGDANPRQPATLESPSGAAKINTPQAQTANGWRRFGSGTPAQATQGQGSAKPSTPVQNQPAGRQPAKPFAPPNAATNNNGRSNGSAGQPAATGSARSNGNWQRFPGPSSTNPNPGGSARPNGAQTITSRPPASNPSAQPNGGWQHFPPPTRTESPRSSYRPPLNMNKPVVTQRTPSPYSGGSYRGGNSGGGGTYRSAPQPNGGYRGPSGPSGGGYRSAPSGSGGGGGGSRGGNGGGSHSAPPRSSNGGPRH